MEVITSLSKSSIKVEIKCNRTIEVIVSLRDQFGKFSRMFYWKLMAGTNVTSLKNLQESELNYRVEIADITGNKLDDSVIKYMNKDGSVGG